MCIRLFVSKCAKCQQSFSKNDLFIRTNAYRRFHPDCFRCDQCDRLLTSGDEYYLHRQNEILCRQHFQQLSFNETSSTESKSSCSDSLGISTAGKINVCRAYTLTSVRMWRWREGRNRRHAFHHGSQISLGCTLFTLERWKLLISQYGSSFFLSFKTDAVNKCTCRLIRNVFSSSRFQSPLRSEQDNQIFFLSQLNLCW